MTSLGAAQRPGTATGLVHPAGMAAGLIAISRCGLTRDQLFAGLFVVACVNGFFNDAGRSVQQLGWLEAVAVTFGISAIVLGACGLGIAYLLRGSDEAASRSDLGVTLIALCALSLPFSSIAWLTLSALALYVLVRSTAGSNRRRGASILLAVTVPVFWSKLLFTVIGKPILQADALLVSLATGASRVGNVVGFAGGPGAFQIFPGCSSVSNMSLAFLAWVTVGQLIDRRLRVADLSWYVLACLSVIAVNVARLSVISLYPQHFATIHGATGSGIVGWLTFGLIVAITFYGFRRDLLARP